jgi:hypothetical protein
MEGSGEAGVLASGAAGVGGVIGAGAADAICAACSAAWTSRASIGAPTSAKALSIRGAAVSALCRAGSDGMVAAMRSASGALSAD